MYSLQTQSLISLMLLRFKTCLRVEATYPIYFQSNIIV